MTEADNQLARGVAAAERKDWAEAARLLLPLAEAGDAVARCNLATMYSIGFGVPVDVHKAAELYLDVAERGIEEGHLSALAYHNLAVLYVTGGPAFERDLDKAGDFERLAKAAGFKSGLERIK
jgi:TPR repeat protein